MDRSTIGAVAAVVVAVVFLLAAITKLARPAEWKAQAADLGVPSALASVVPFVEVVLGALLLVQWHRHVMAWCAVAVLALFTALLVVRLAQGRRSPCACFGSLSAKPIGPHSVARNAVFIAVAVVAAVL
jgi:uncharacterized membrane protein YphA (DoxX/SURF4 family)